MAGRGSRESVADRRARRAEIDDPEVVLAAALRFLEARSRSVAEVRRRLGFAGYRPDLVEGAIGRLSELGMLDDAEFARQWVESRDRAHPRGERALVMELRQKGIDAPTVAATLALRRDADAESGTVPAADAAAAARLLARHARALDRVADPRVRRQKAYALLARNGFDPETCREAAAGVEGVDADGDVDAE
ncbi:MAG TPA: regulatory protein RecX [Candidatus Limnocylindrales bacterium]|jgi:regulatory protein